MEKSIKKGALLSYLSISVNLIAGLIYTPWMIRQIGQSQYGIYTLTNSIITLLMFDFGLSSATARYVSILHAKGDEKEVGSFLSTIYKLYILVDAVIFVVFIIIYAFMDQIYLKLNPVELHQFRIAYIIVALYSLISFPFVTLNGLMTAYEQFVQLKLADIIYRFLVVLFMIIALKLEMGLYALVSVNALVGLIIIVYKWICIKKVTSFKISFKGIDKRFFKEILGYSIWITFFSLAQRLVFNITPSILGAVASSAAIAVFGVVTTIEQYSYLISTAINGMFMPKISRIYAGVDTEKDISGLFLSVGGYQFLIGAAIAVGFAVVGKEFILLWMGAQYSEAYLCILLVIIPGVFYNSLQIAHTSMMVNNYVKTLAYINLGMGLCNVFLSLFLSKYYGVVGASFSIFVAYTLRLILILVVYPKYLKIKISKFIYQCYFKLGILSIIWALFGVVINKLFYNADLSWRIFLVKGCILSLIIIISGGWIIIKRGRNEEKGQN